MKGSVAEYEKEYRENLGEELTQATSQMQDDPLSLGLLLYQVAEERKSTNLIIKNLYAQIEAMSGQMNALSAKLSEMDRKQAAPNTQLPTELSDRDKEVFEYVKTKGRVCAEELQRRLKYRGKNAASARLSKLFHEGRLEKEYAGRRVYYKVR